MYLEISKRQSGKSARLRDAIGQYLAYDQDSVAVLISTSSMAAHRIKQCFPSSMQKRIITRLAFPLNYYIFPRLFVDEFDWIDPNYFRELGETYLRDGYFVTTPAKMRDVESYKDIMWRLVALNGGRWFSFGSGSDTIEGTWRNRVFKAQIWSSGIMETEFYGHWLKPGVVPAIETNVIDAQSKQTEHIIKWKV